MKRLLFTMIVASAMIISLNSCNKDDSLPIPNTDTGTGSSDNSNTIALVTNHWERMANGVLVSLFPNVIPPRSANQSINVYLVSGDQVTPINQPITLMNGVLWATNTQTDLAISYRGNLQTAPILDIKVVIE
jgi:hypothetical protein